MNRFSVPVLQIPVDNLIVVMFEKGWEYFQDLGIILTDMNLAQMALARCVDYCSSNLSVYQANLERIAALHFLNPNNVDGVEEIIMGLGLEVYFTAYENHLFEITTPRSLPYQFYKVSPSRIVLQRII